MHSFHLKVDLDTDNNFLSAEGTLSEVDEVTLMNTENEEGIRYFSLM